jgi:hypothetical protein
MCGEQPTDLKKNMPVWLHFQQYFVSALSGHPVNILLLHFDENKHLSVHMGNTECH